MDYQFIRNAYDQPMAEFSMGAEAFGPWFTEELGNDHTKITLLLTTIEQLQNKQLLTYLLKGAEFQLHLNNEEVQVVSRWLATDAPEELPEGTELYDQESIAGCGLEDFKQVLESWLDFINE